MEEKIKLRLEHHKETKKDILSRLNNPRVRHDANFILDQAKKLNEICIRIDELEALGWM